MLLLVHNIQREVCHHLEIPFLLHYIIVISDACQIQQRVFYDFPSVVQLPHKLREPLQVYSIHRISYFPPMSQFHSQRQILSEEAVQYLFRV